MSAKITQEAKDAFFDKKLSNREFAGVWIPKQLYFCQELTPAEKFLLVEINSFTRCFCSNRHLAMHIGVSASRVSQILSSLQKRGYITTKIIYKKGTKEVESRIISTTPLFRKLNSPVEDTNPPVEDTNPPCLEYCEDTNTSITNTNYSNTTTNVVVSNVQQNGSSEAKTRQKKTKTAKKPNAEINFDNWPSPPSPDVWKDYLATRKAKRAQTTQTAINRMAKQLHIAASNGMSVDECLEQCCERGWVAFNWSWTDQAKSGERTSEATKTTIPDGFSLTRERIALARSAANGLSRDITDVFNAFVTHFRATGGKCADWDARWSSWVIEEANRERNRYKTKQEQASDKYTRDMSVIAGITGREWAGDNLNTIESQHFIEKVIGHA